MDKNTVESQSPQGKGQTLAEFALTLPILLLLLFGIIEFGRLFQSWVTLQNAARTAVRYASTGQYKEDRYNIDEIVTCLPNAGKSSVGPIIEVGFERGRGLSNTVIELFDAPTDAGAVDERLYGNWYGNPLGCEPGPESDQSRKDILRLPSIYEEARRGAAGLLLENSRVEPNANSVQEYLYSQFQRPHPDVDKLDWFDVVICSTREKLYNNDDTYIIDLDTGLETADPEFDTQRFELVFDEAQYAPVACVLREQSKNPIIPANGLDPWMDAGGPGERVTVVITLNHRLITPIGLANMIPIRAQRSAINESFRVTNAERALSPSSNPAPGSVVDETATPVVEETEDVLESPTHTYTPTFTHTPPSPSPEPFSCENIDVFFRDVPFTTNRFFIEFANFNVEDTYIKASEIHWDKSVVEDEYPDINLANMSLENEVYWFMVGGDDTPPTIANDEGELLYDPDTTDHSIYVPSGGEMVLWQGQFLNGPSQLHEHFIIQDFDGTNFVFSNPEGDDCRVFVSLPPIPSPTPEPPGFESPTPTFTPDCASLTMRVEFVSFEVAGDVTLRIINDGPRNAPFTGFNLVWPPMSGVGLDKVVFGGRNALDTPEFGGDGIIMWDSPFGGGDTSPVTDSASEPNFQTQVFVPAFTSTLVHLDFVGVAGKLPISPSDLNGSRFDIWCGQEGTPFGGTTSGGGGSGGGPGSIFLAEENTPVPTDQPPPTWTPLSETNTPTDTPPPALPTDTFTPQPTVNTLTPSNTPPATNTPSPTPTISFGGGGVDG